MMTTQYAGSFALEPRENYEIIGYGRPRTGLALAMEHKPDAIVLDLQIPNFRASICIGPSAPLAKHNWFLFSL